MPGLTGGIIIGRGWRIMFGGPGIICMGPPIGGLMPPRCNGDGIHSFRYYSLHQFTQTPTSVRWQTFSNNLLVFCLIGPPRHRNVWLLKIFKFCQNWFKRYWFYSDIKAKERLPIRKEFTHNRIINKYSNNPVWSTASSAYVVIAYEHSLV